MTVSDRNHATRSDTPAMNLQQFGGLLGVLMAVAAAIALMTGVSADYDSENLGFTTVECGSTFAPAAPFADDAKLACSDAIGTRRAWGWPLGIVGLVLIGGAAVYEQNQARSRAKPADS